MADFFWFSDAQWARIEPLLPTDSRSRDRVDDRRVLSGIVHDCKPARRCIAAMPPAKQLVADKGYDSKALREWLQERGTTAVIPPRKNRKVQYDYDKTIYKQRNIIERMFCRLKDWRRIATRFDRNVKNFFAAIALAATVIWWL